MNSNPIIGCLSIPNPSTHILLSWELNEIPLFLHQPNPPIFWIYCPCFTLYQRLSWVFEAGTTTSFSDHLLVLYLGEASQIYLVPTPIPRSKRIIFLPPAFVVVSYSASRLNLKQNSSVRISNEWMKQRLSKIRPNSRQYFCHTFLAPLNPPYENHIKDGFPKNGNFRTIFTTLRALLKSGLCATPLLYSRSDTSS